MNKLYLNSIIVLALIVAGVAIFGTTNHYMGYYDPSGKIAESKKTKDPDPTPTPDPTPDPDPAPADKEVLGYKCKYANCAILDGTSVISNKYAFIVDGEENVVLFDIETLEVHSTYKMVSVSGRYYIAKNTNDKYGVLAVSNVVTEMAPFEYTFIEYVSSKENFIFTKVNSSFVADRNCEVITLSYNAQIIDYNEYYIITKTTSGDYHIFNYNNRTELTEYVNSKRRYIELVKNYVGVVTDDYKYQLYDFKNDNKLITEYQLKTTSDKIHAVINNENQLQIIVDDNLEKTIDL